MSVADDIKRDYRMLRSGSTFERLNNRGLHALAVYRISHELWRRKVPLVGSLLTRVIQILYGIDIHPRAVIAPGIQIFHGVGLVIAPRTIVGEGCVLRHGVTLGMVTENSPLPVLGRRVIVNAGAQILGPVTVGDDAVIGANAVVLKDVPAMHAAVGVPARNIDRSHKFLEPAR